jgi:hypothetical protein
LKARKLDSGLFALMCINVGIVVGASLGLRSKDVDRLSLGAVVLVSFAVLNGMFLWVRKTDSNLPAHQIKRWNKWILWPLAILGILVMLLDVFAPGK